MILSSEWGLSIKKKKDFKIILLLLAKSFVFAESYRHKGIVNKSFWHDWTYD
ncbi:hypothetical protein ES703_95109 [subsurface metagenome]